MGLDEAGKTTLVQRFVNGLEDELPPSEEVEEVVYQHPQSQVVFRELGGRFRYRDLWSNHFEGVDALIWVVDSIDRGRIIESVEEFDRIKRDFRIATIPTIVLFTKQDAKYAQDPNFLVNQFMSRSDCTGVHFVATDAVEACGMEEETDHLLKQVIEQRKLFQE